MYAILMETNGDEYESWYYFIKHEGNEEALNHLQEQLKQIEDMYILDGCSTFDLDIDHLVSESTAKEMTKVELNSITFHRKFDGKMSKIDLGFKPGDKNKRKLIKLFKKLGYGQIEKYVEDEDVEYTEGSGNEDEDEELRTVSSSSEEEDSSSEEEPPKTQQKGKGKQRKAKQ